MVYLGPVTTLSPRVKTKATTGYSPEHDMPVSKTVSRTQQPAAYPKVERRRGDRRQNQRDALLESRMGDRRRGGAKKIDVTV